MNRAYRTAASHPERGPAGREFLATINGAAEQAVSK